MVWSGRAGNERPGTSASVPTVLSVGSVHGHGLPPTLHTQDQDSWQPLIPHLHFGPGWINKSTIYISSISELCVITSKTATSAAASRV